MLEMEVSNIARRSQFSGEGPREKEFMRLSLEQVSEDDHGKEKHLQTEKRDG